MAAAPRILHLVLLALVAACLAPQVCAQYIHRGWQPGLPSKREGEPAFGANYRKDRGWTPQGIKRPPSHRQGSDPPETAFPESTPASSAESVVKPPRAPRNQTLTEHLMRFGLTRVLRWSDERVDETQDRLRERNNPTFHPRIQKLNGSNYEYADFLKALGYADHSTLDQDSVLAGMVNTVIGTPSRAVTKPWAILFSAPGNDKESHKFDVIFNRTVHSLWPDPSTGFAPIIKGADKPGVDVTKVIEQTKASVTATPSLPEGYEIVGGFTVRVAEPTGVPVLPQRKSFLAGALPKLGSLLLGSDDAAPQQSEEDLNASAESELTGKEILSPVQWGVRQALVEAHLPAVEAEELQFAYVDFVRQPVIEWLWGIWKVPLVVFVTPTPPGSEQPFHLRYWKVSQNMPNVNEVITFLGSGSWKSLPVWESEWAPGGSKFPRMLTSASFLGTYWYPFIQRIPSWAIMILSTAFASFIPKLMHPGDNKKLKEIAEAKRRRKALEQARQKSIATKEREAEDAALVPREPAVPAPAAAARTKASTRPQTRKLRAGRR